MLKISLYLFRYLYSLLAAIFPLVCQPRVLHHMRMSAPRRRRALLDRLLQLDPEPVDLRLFQQGFQRSIQEHATVRLLFAVSEAPVRSELHRSATAQYEV